MKHYFVVKTTSDGRPSRIYIAGEGWQQLTPGAPFKIGEDTCYRFPTAGGQMAVLCREPGGRWHVLSDHGGG